MNTRRNLWSKDRQCSHAARAGFASCAYTPADKTDKTQHDKTQHSGIRLSLPLLAESQLHRPMGADNVYTPANYTADDYITPFQLKWQIGHVWASNYAGNVSNPFKIKLVNASHAGHFDDKKDS